MNKRIALWMGLCLALLAGPWSAQAAVFKCADATGNQVFQDRPCAGSVQAAPLIAAKADAAPPGKSGNLLWKASAPGGTVYFMGSIHFGTPAMYPLPTVITEAFKRADALVVEADVLNVDPQAMAGVVAAKAMYQDGSSLQSQLPPALWQRLGQVSSSMGLPAQLLERQKPWFASMTLTALTLQRYGFSEELGVDQHFLQQAAREGKRVIELESIEQQLGLFDAFSPAEQVAMLEQTLDDIERGPQFLRDTVAAWKAGDDGRLDALLNEEYRTDAASQRMYRLLIVERNHTMSTKIAGLLQQGGTYFVVVGAGHLVGDESIVNLLRGKGYRLDKL